MLIYRIVSYRIVSYRIFALSLKTGTVTKGFDARLANRLFSVSDSTVSARVSENQKIKWSVSQPDVESVNYIVAILGTLSLKVGQTRWTLDVAGRERCLLGYCFPVVAKRRIVGGRRGTIFFVVSMWLEVFSLGLK